MSEINIKKRTNIGPLKLNQKLLKLFGVVYKQAIFTKVITMFNVVINTNVLQGNTLVRMAVETYSLKLHSTQFHDFFRHWPL